MFTADSATKKRIPTIEDLLFTQYASSGAFDSASVTPRKVHINAPDNVRNVTDKAALFAALAEAGVQLPKHYTGPQLCEQGTFYPGMLEEVYGEESTWTDKPIQLRGPEYNVSLHEITDTFDHVNRFAQANAVTYQLPEAQSNYKTGYVRILPQMRMQKMVLASGETTKTGICFESDFGSLTAQIEEAAFFVCEETLELDYATMEVVYTEQTFLITNVSTRLMIEDVPAIQSLLRLYGGVVTTHESKQTHVHTSRKERRAVLQQKTPVVRRVRT